LFRNQELTPVSKCATFSAMSNRIRQLRQAQGLSLQDVVDRLAERGHHCSRSTIFRLETGGAKLTEVWARRLAEALGTDPATVAGFAPRPDARVLRPVSIIGAAEAGVWRRGLEFDDPEQQIDWSLPPSPQWGDHHIFALYVRGPSMDCLYPDGSVVICARFSDLGRLPRPGDKVVCQRRRNDGLAETTIKELAPDATGAIWLWPRSHHPAHQQPLLFDGSIEPGDAAQVDNQTELQIIAKVIGCLRAEA